MERLTGRDIDGNAYSDAVGGANDLGIDLGIKDICYRGEIIEKLANYEDLEEDGKLIKIPCITGDTVYIIRENRPEETYVKEVKHDNTYGWHVVVGRCIVYPFSEFGQTIFTDKHDAEEKLKEMGV